MKLDLGSIYFSGEPIKGMHCLVTKAKIQHCQSFAGPNLQFVCGELLVSSQSALLHITLQPAFDAWLSQSLSSQRSIPSLPIMVGVFYPQIWRQVMRKKRSRYLLLTHICCLTREYRASFPYNRCWSKRRSVVGALTRLKWTV